MSKTRNLVGKVFMIAFLVMVVVGFTVPIVLNNISPESDTYVEPRVCQTDMQCALDCNGQPIAVLCSQNLCQQNSCTQLGYYPFTEKPMVFSLQIDAGNGTIDLASRTDASNFFVTFADVNKKEENKEQIKIEQIKVYAAGLTIAQILEKVKITPNAQCVTIDQTYCTTDTKKWIMNVNGQESPLFDYTPQEGDVIGLVYKYS